MKTFWALLILLYLCGFGGATKSEAEAKGSKSPQRGSFVIEYAGDKELCKVMVVKRKFSGKTIWNLIPPLEATTSLFGTNNDMLTVGYHRYQRGSFDFDNDGKTEAVYSSVIYGTTLFIVNPDDAASTSHQEGNSDQRNPWPEGFGRDWLDQHNRRIYPGSWSECSQTDSCVYHLKNFQDTLFLGNLRMEIFRYRDVRYFLGETISPNGPDSGTTVLF